MTELYEPNFIDANSKFGGALFHRACMTTESIFGYLDMYKDIKTNPIKQYIKLVIEFRRELHEAFKEEDPNKIVIDKIYEEICKNL